jgi:hypothetical protein
MTETNVTVDANIAVDANIDLSAITNNIAEQFLTLFTDPMYVIALLCTFMLGMFINFVMKGYFGEKITRKTQALFVWGGQLVGGYLITVFFVDQEMVAKLAAFSGVLTIMLYYIALWAANKFNLVWLRHFLKIKALDNASKDFEITVIKHKDEIDK